MDMTLDTKALAMMNGKTMNEEDVRKFPGKKNTRDWCRGKVGKPHVWNWENWHQLKAFRRRSPSDPVTWLIQVCAGCGKHGKSEYARSYSNLFPVTDGWDEAYKEYQERIIHSNE